MAQAPDGGLALGPLRAALAPAGVRIGARRIAPGDEAAFTTDSAEPLARRRASGAARLVARRLLAELGGDSEPALPRSASRAPVWPAGFVGSLAHDAEYAVAAVARARDLASLGVDVEPAEPLPDDVLEFALNANERRQAATRPIAGRAIFAAKEAVYKAIHPLDGSPLEYDEIDVDLENGRAKLADGRTLILFADCGARVIAVALPT